MNQAKLLALNTVDRMADVLCRVSDFIFDHPETAFRESASAEALISVLADNGFSITRDIAGMETAFMARFGQGGPVIGILAEYDALAAMSQQPGLLHPAAVNEGAPGHACGHNLLGAGALGGALAVKEYLETTGRPGTVICYGCPGEEGGSGKAFMARDGFFDGIDCALTWHPATVNIVPPSATLANFQVGFRFKGVSSHAASAPHLGRSALDAMELMHSGIQYLREHMLPDARIHYAVLNAGGTAPNVVQAEAEGLYLIRAPKARQVEEIFNRVEKIAQGAALMTETTVTQTSFKATYDIVLNHTLGRVLAENLSALGAPRYTEAEWDYAQKLNATIAHPNRLLETAAQALGPKGAAMVEPYLGKAIYDITLPYAPIRHILTSSSDVGDVSWKVPTAQVATVTMCAGTPGHSWQLASQGKSSIAHKGMLLAAKTMAGGAIDLINNPQTLAAAKAEHEKAVGGSYKPLIPADLTPMDVLSAPEE